MKNKLVKTTEYLFYLLIFLLPWQTRWIIRAGSVRGEFFEYGSYSLFTTDILLIIIFVLYLFLVKGRLYFDQKLKNLWPVLLAFILVNFLSVVIAVDKGIAWYGLGKMIEAVMIFYLAVQLPITLRKSSLALVLSAGIQSALALWQFFSQQVLAFKWLGLAEQLPWQPGVYVVENFLGRFLRAYGSLHPIILSYFLAISLIIILGLYFVTKKSQQKIFVWSALYLVILGLILTFGRVAWLSVVVGFLLFILLIWWRLTKQSRKKLFIFFLVIVIGTGIFSFIFKDILVTRLTMSARLEQLSISERSFYLQDAVNLTKENWYRGTGVYNFTQAVKQQIASSRPSWNYQPPNNLFFLILAELSVFGLLIFVWLLVEIFRLIIERLQKLKLPDDWWFLVYSICFIVLLITAFFDHTYWTLQFGLLFFWLILGLWARSLKS
ncbi:O-antigen ligase family protein [Patescibacteria group bacterium]|nr:O-antigen ligase family protein [Patescibacteria group bacterium]